jgi:hypothetical protein
MKITAAAVESRHAESGDANAQIRRRYGHADAQGINWRLTGFASISTSNESAGSLGRRLVTGNKACISPPQLEMSCRFESWPKDATTYDCRIA